VIFYLRILPYCLSVSRGDLVRLLMSSAFPSFFPSWPCILSRMYGLFTIVFAQFFSSFSPFASRWSGCTPFGTLFFIPPTPFPFYATSPSAQPDCPRSRRDIGRQIFLVLLSRNFGGSRSNLPAPADPFCCALSSCSDSAFLNRRSVLALERFFLFLIVHPGFHGTMSCHSRACEGGVGLPFLVFDPFSRKSCVGKSIFEIIPTFWLICYLCLCLAT